jgi:hypothetical protein
MSLFGRHTPKHAAIVPGVRTPRRVDRVPLPPGMPGMGAAMYVEQDDDGRSELYLAAQARKKAERMHADPDSTMAMPVVEDDTPAVRPIPVPELNVPAEWPPLPVRQPAPQTAALASLRARLADARPPADVLQKTLDSLRYFDVNDEPQQDEPEPASPGACLPVSPGAYLFNVTPDDKPNPYEVLDGFPVFAGTRRLGNGTPVVGLYLGNEDPAGRPGLDVLDRTYLLRLRDAVEDAENALWAMEEADREAAEGSDAA